MAGESFSVDNGDGTVSIYMRETVGSTLQRTLATTAALAASSGSSLVGFIQSGTGAVARTMQDKARDVVSVLDFGADPTGTTDSSAAIGLAFAASNNVEFPPGSYLMNTGVVKVGDNIKVDFGSAVIVNGGANYLFKFGTTSDTPQNSGLKISGGYFTQADPATTLDLNYIRIAGFKGFAVTGCNLKNVSNGGIMVEAGCEDGLIDGVTINGSSGYSTCRGIWLNGATASDYAAQLVDISSIARNATAVPIYCVKSMRVVNCNVAIPAYGIYSINTRDTHIDGCHIDISGSGNRGISLNNYSPGAIVKNNTLRGGQASTGILVTQFSHDVIVDGNTFLGTFGGGRDIHVQYLADCQITNNRFNTDSTQQISVNMGGSAVIRGNYFTRTSGVTPSGRCVLLTTIDEAVAGTGVYGDTATVLPGIVFTGNVVKYRLSVVNVRALTSASGNIPGLDVVTVEGNVFYNFDQATTTDEYPLKITAPGTTYSIAYSYFGNTVYPAANATRNGASITGGTGASAIRTDISVAVFRIANAASGGAVTSSKLWGGYFSCGATRSSNDCIISPRTVAGGAGAAVAVPIGVTDASGNAYRYDIRVSGANYVIRVFDSAGTQIPLSTTAATFDVAIAHGIT